VRVTSLSPLFKVLAHASRNFPLLWLTLGISVASIVVELIAMASLFPLAEVAIGREFVPQGVWVRVISLFPERSSVLMFLCLFLVLLFARVATGGLVLILQAKLGRLMIAHFSASAFEAFVKHLSFKDIQEKTIGHFMTLAGDEANRASQTVLASLRLVPTLLLAALYLGALFVHSLWVGAGVVAFLVCMGIGMVGAFRTSHQLGRRQQDESRSLNTFFVDALSGLRTVRGFNAEDYAASRYRQMIDRYVRTCFAVDLVSILGRILPALLLLVVALLGAAFFVDQETVTRNIGFAMAATAIILRFLPLVGQALDTLMRLVADLRAGEHIAHVVDTVDQAASAPAHATAAPRIARLEFDRVSFSYDDATPILQGFSAAFIAGRSYAIIGPSGSGKSTFVDLLLGFYSPCAGEILLNGVNIANFGASAIRARVGLVEQQARLLSDSVRNNLAFGRPAASQEIDQAVRIAQLEDVMAALPDGLDSSVAYQGSNLSGGQRQRISIARALVKETDVLVLDEGTNGLDAPTRDRILASLREIYRERILICLTHDKDVIAQVDEVVTLKGSEALPAPVHVPTTRTGRR
jgi:ABC-type bacteriocin/lantibiotic exporter with double-glycine peptidase domain